MEKSGDAAFVVVVAGGRPLTRDEDGNVDEDANARQYPPSTDAAVRSARRRSKKQADDDEERGGEHETAGTRWARTRSSLEYEGRQ